MAVINNLKSGGKKLPESVFYGFWIAEVSVNNAAMGYNIYKIYDNGTMDVLEVTIDGTIQNDVKGITYTISGKVLTPNASAGTLTYQEDGTLYQLYNGQLPLTFTRKLFSNGALSVTENGTYKPLIHNGYASVEVNVQGGDYDINAVYNDDGTQSLAIVDSDSSIDRNAEIKQLKEVIKRLIERKESNVTLPDNLATVIGSYSFYKWNNLNRIVIPEGVVTIESGAFYNCANMYYATIASSVETIGDSAFYYCALSSVIFKQNSMLSRLGGGAFYSNKNLKKITLPSKLSYIGGNAFYDCSSLTVMTILATTPPTLSNTNAISTATTTIYIPAGTLSAYQSATNWSSFASKFVELEV